MEIIAYLFVLGVLIYLGYAYANYRKSRSNPLTNPLTGDEDFVDCQSQARAKFGAGTSEYNKDIVGCYIHKKTDRVKKLLDETD
jgi:hypothetical protein